jgi:ankyrin repeat protein
MYGHALEALGAAWAPIGKIAYLYEKNTVHGEYQYEQLVTDAIRTGNLNLIKYLAAQGDLIETIPSRKPPLVHAMESERYGVLLYLLSLGLDANKPEPTYNLTPLHVAAKNNDLNSLKILIDWSAKIEAKDQKGMTPLHDAAYSCARDAINYLLDHHANQLSADKKGQTPFDLFLKQNCGEATDAERLFRLNNDSDRSNATRDHVDTSADKVLSNHM